MCQVCWSAICEGCQIKKLLPIGSMGRTVYLPIHEYTKKVNHSWIGKYTVRPMDPMGYAKYFTTRIILVTRCW